MKHPRRPQSEVPGHRSNIFVHRRAPRPIDRIAKVDREFSAVAEIVGRSAERMLAVATDAATDRGSALVATKAKGAPIIDLTEPLSVEYEQGTADDPPRVWLDVHCVADPSKRVLAGLRIHLDLYRPHHGHGRGSEVHLRAIHEPSANGRSAPENALFRRRVVHAAVDELLAVIVRFLEDYEETLAMRIATGS